MFRVGIELLGDLLDIFWFPASDLDKRAGARLIDGVRKDMKFKGSDPVVFHDAVPLTARCGLETSDMTEDPQTMVQDRVLTTTNDRSGYFLLTPQKSGWTPGYYRCGLFAGEQASAYSYMDEVRFRIMNSHRP